MFTYVPAIPILTSCFFLFLFCTEDVDMRFWNVCMGTPGPWVPGSPDTTMELGSGVKVATGTSAVGQVVPQSVGVEVQHKTWD